VRQCVGYLEAVVHLSNVRFPPIADIQLPCDPALMRTYWTVVLAIGLADAALITLLLVKDGGPEGLVWWAFLIIPMAVAALVVVGIILQFLR
jgi:hypothetical protein